MTGVRQRLSGLSERWKSLRPTTRRVLTLGAVFVLGGLLFMVGMPDRKPRTLGKSSGDAYEFHNPDLAAEVLTESLQAKIAVQSSQIAEMNRRMEQLEQERRRTNASTPKPQAPAPASVDKTILMDEIGKMLPSSPIVPSSEPLFIAPPSVPAGTSSSKEKSAEVSTPPKDQGQTVENGPVPPAPRSLGVLSWTPTPTPVAAADGTAPSKVKSGMGGTTGKKDDDAPGFYIPSGAFFEVQLLTGLDAPTGAKAKSSPSPILFRIQNLAWLPNEVKQNVLGCFLLSEGIGELSTERVNIRGLSISCEDNEGKTAIDQKILGFVADSDGKAGLRGPVASKAGALLAQTMKAGFVQGLAEFFSFSSRSVSITDSGGGLSVPDTEEYGKNLAGGAFSGMSKALEKVSDYYMDLADEVFPVIQVGAARKATFVLTQGAELRFAKALSTTPEDTTDAL